MTTLDILIPHFNDAEGLQASLASIEAQDWKGARRVIVVDDGSELAHKQALYRCLERFQGQSLLIEHSVNRGRPQARNTALLNVSAPYVAWLDAGDIWYPKKLSRQFAHLRFLEDKGADVGSLWVSCHYDWEERGSRRFLLQDTSHDLFTELMLGSRIRAYLWTLLGRTEAFSRVGLFDEKLPRMQDLDYFLRFVLAGGSIGVPRAREPLCCYFKSDAGRSHRDVSRSARHIFLKYEMDLRQAGLHHRVAWKNASLAARFATNNGQKLAALSYRLGAVATYPRYAMYQAKRRLLNG